MKIVRYRSGDRVSYGFLSEERVIDLPRLARLCTCKLPSAFEKFIAWNPTAEAAEKLMEKAERSMLEAAAVRGDEADLLCPISSPSKIICLGLNYVDHAAETGLKLPEEPIFFMKPRTALIGPNENIVKPGFVKQLDYEGELAIIIAKKGKNIPVQEARKHVFGFSIMNDVSARDLQFKDGQWTRAKSFDTFAPLGTCIVTCDQLADTSDLRIRTWVNGELRQNSTTKNMVFNIDEIIHHLSRVMTLEPCDIIASGTPAGVGFAMKPPQFLQHGDVVRIEVQGVGMLENAVRESCAV
jgi:2-keto-4-pentenoate hydratase/2-oxohepta-3-ene-1,7-dioic acid hydratase in catechol pathway